ncbi:MAG: molybdenum cofactor biosynthesis protein MoaE [Verrucomicrobiota bacterium]|nr:molybdenum cofactor biosynthesis protein MoaE [Verrucomicrobiota bacterium]
MEIEVQLTKQPIAEKISPAQGGAAGAWLEFRGVVRGSEDEKDISALEYEAYAEMAWREIRRILESLALKWPCLAVKVVHRIGVIPVGETAIYASVAAAHRHEAIGLLAEFMDRLKQDVPIWKRRAMARDESGNEERNESRNERPARAGQRAHDAEASGQQAAKSADEARMEISSRCRPLPPERQPLPEAAGCILRETVRASEDMPPADRSTRDGYAVRLDDASQTFLVVDTLHAADWRPRGLQTGQAVRVATGASLPCQNLQVIMQEDVVRVENEIRIVRRGPDRNVSLRGEDMRAGAVVLETGARLDAGALALLATVGCVHPLVSPRLRVRHFTTGDEIVSPEIAPKAGQIRDSNSSLIRGLLRPFECDLIQGHLPENFDEAASRIGGLKVPGNPHLLLISGGASVGDKDFTRALLEWLGFEIVFSQVNARPGRPLIFGIHGSGVAFGLPGNPLSHFVCFHLAVAGALAALTGGPAPKWSRGRLAGKLEGEPSARETFWPARWAVSDEGTVRLHLLAWANSGNVACLASANALARIPAQCGRLDPSAIVEFLPVSAMPEKL